MIWAQLRARLVSLFVMAIPDRHYGEDWLNLGQGPVEFTTERDPSKLP